MRKNILGSEGGNGMNLKNIAFGCAAGIFAALAYFVASVSSWVGIVSFILLCSGINILGYIHGVKSKGGDSA
jgi:hypothetical protein